MPNQFGSFGNISPEAMSAVRNAMQRRQAGGGSPALNQQSAMSPTSQPAPPPAAQVPSGGMAMPQGQKQPASEAEIILKAMSSRLSSENKIKEAGVGLGKVQ